MFLTTVLTQSKPVFNTVVRPVSAAVPRINVTRPRLAHLIVTKSKSPIRRHLTRSPSPKTSNSPPRVTAAQALVGNPQYALKDKGVIDSGCSRHMIENLSYLSDFEELNGGYVAFGGNPKGGKIYGKGKIKTGKLDFDDVYFVKELKFNLFSVSQICDKKNNVLFTDTECIVLSPDFKLPDESQVLLRVSGENNMYDVNLKNIIPSEDLTCLFAKCTKNPQQNERKNRTLIEAARTTLADSLLPIPFWAEAVNTACYIQNKTMNHQPVNAGNQTNPRAGFQDKFDAEKAREEVDQQYVLFLVLSSGFTNPQNYDGNAAFDDKEHDFDSKKPESEVILSLSNKFKDCSDNSGNEVNAASSIVHTVGKNSINNTNTFSAAGPLNDITYSDDEDVVGADADFNNLESSISVSPIPTTRIHKNHAVSQIIGDLSSTTQTRSMTRVVKDQEEPKRVRQALKDPSWIKAMQEELLQFNVQKVWVLVDLPLRKRAIVARIEAIRLFLAYASFMDFMVYQMDVRSAFLYGTIEEEVYVCQPPGCEDPDHPNKVYRVVKELYGLHQAPKACQDKYVAEILRKFGLTEGKSASTPIDTEKPLLKDPDGKDVDVHTYRPMIGSLMYLTSSRPDIMFAVCACALFQVTPKASHLHAVKRIFRYLKGKPHLGLWYPKDSPFDLVAYSNSDYAGASLDRKSTIVGCQFLRCRLISWQCKKQTVVATSSTEAEYVATARIASPDQTVSGKDKSNPLMADNLPKIIWYSTHHVTLMKSWLVQKQTALGQTTTGKEISNPFMAGSLPKTILTTFIHDNDVTRLQALVDKKKMVITEAAIKEVLRLDDAEGVDYLPNEEIIAELARIGYEKPSTKLTFYKAFFSSQWKFIIHTILQSLSAKRTLWNKFSLAMAYAVICLSTEHVEDDTAAQGDDITAQGDDAPEPSIPSPTSPTLPPQPPQDLPSTSQVQHTPPQSPQPQPQPQPQAQQQAADFLMSLLQEALDACAALTRRVEHLEYDKVAQALEITKLQRRRVDTSEDTMMDDASNQGRKIDELDKDDAVALIDDKEEDNKEEEAKVVEDDQVQGRQAESQAEIYKIDLDHASTFRITAASTIISAAEPQVPAATITAARDKGKGIMVEEPKPLKKKQQVEMDEEYARKLHAKLNKDIDWDVAIDHVKQKAKKDPAVQRYQFIKKKPQTEAQARKNMIMYLKNVASFRLDYFKGMSYDDIPKRRKLNEEVEDLKIHLEIVPDEDDDVYTEATPLARKVPVIDYEIINLNNKPYYKIIRADGTHQFYISFLTLLKNFNREDLEALWSLVKERFSTSKPNNFFDDFLLTTLGAMFKEPDRQAQLILLVERRYPLSRFTLDQMLNAVRLQVEKEGEMSLELLRLSAAKLKMMLLDSAAEGTLMMLSQIKTVNDKCCF
uniref:Uncharacterized mitochondrial protein AtMg00810-like n=1 Tax=Tanacetum cinerariifolium TaxID=118510 RepID=A0A6L2K5R9_TANCI|nr:uncharacterized mitochondrial protein AtMg00810-like [Tanacetum cinerariifolium]